MKLELKHVTPYLQHKVLLTYKDASEGKQVKAYLTGVTTMDIETTYKRKIKGCSGDLIGWVGHNNVSDLEVKLVLRNLSDLTKEIEVNGEKFVPIDLIEVEGYIIGWNGFGITMGQEEGYSFGYAMDVHNNIIQKLLGWNFDIFCLIENNLAVDINTL